MTQLFPVVSSIIFALVVATTVFVFFLCFCVSLFGEKEETQTALAIWLLALLNLIALLA